MGKGNLSIWKILTIMKDKFYTGVKRSVWKTESLQSMVSKNQERRASHRNRDHCWVTRAAECSSQQDLGTAASQHPAILPCSTLHLFSLEIIHTAFKALRFMRLSRTGIKFPGVFASLLQLVRSLHQYCLWMQHIPRGKRISLHLQFTLAHSMPCTHSTMLSTHQFSSYPGAKKKVCSISFYLLPFPFWLLHG